MRYRRYIKGNRRGREANRIEREAMRDPFLAEALEGYERVKDDPTPHIDILRRKIRSRNQRRLDVFKYGGIAASLLFLLGFGLYFGFHKNNFAEDIVALQAPLEQEQIENPEVTGNIENAIAQNREQEEHQKDTPAPPPVPAAQGVSKPTLKKQKEIEIQAITEDMAMEEMADTAMEEKQIAIPEKLIAAETSVQQEKESIATDADEVLIVTQQSRMAAKSQAPAPVTSGSEPVSGFESYLTYIKEKKIIPTDDCKEAKGKVTLSFLVSTSGKPYSIKVEQSVCISTDKEAIRLLEEGPSWKPSKTRTVYSIEFP